MLQYIRNTGSLDARATDESKTLLQEYPYFEAAHLLYLKSLRKTDEPLYYELLQKHACYIKNKKSLFLYSEGSKYDWLEHADGDIEKTTENGSKKNAVELIDSFLEAYRADKKKQSEKPDIAALDFVPIVDYSYLAKTEALLSEEPTETPSRPKTYQDDLIDRFMEAADSQEKPFKFDAPEVMLKDTVDEEISLPQETVQAEEELLTESLARNFIKQRRYDKALEIIQKLSLKYPEKNIYFADQIRFLQKLIININSK